MGRIPTTTGESLHIYNIGPGAYIAMFAAIALGVLGAAEIAMRLQRTRTEADGEEKSIPAEAATYSDPGGIYSQPAQGIRQAAEIKADVESVPVPATPPRGTLGRAWDDWWGEREKWLTSIVQSALAIAFLVCFFMYLSSHSSSEPLQVAGAKKVRSTTTFGWPGPWLIYETYPSDNTPFRWKINWFSSSTAVMLAGYLAGCMNWQIEKAKAKAKGTVLRWWYGSPLALMGLWAVATFGCVAVVIGMMVMMN